MKSTHFSFASILLLMTLTSCKSQQEQMQAQRAPAAVANNIVYLDSLATRGQDATSAFNEILQSGNVVVDFYANWCNPCRIMGKTIDQVASQFPSVTFLKVDIDKFPALAENIQGIPTLIFYKNGSQVNRFSGTKDKNTFIALLKKSY